MSQQTQFVILSQQRAGIRRLSLQLQEDPQIYCGISTFARGVPHPLRVYLHELLGQRPGKTAIGFVLYYAQLEENPDILPALAGSPALRVISVQVARPSGTQIEKAARDALHSNPWLHLTYGDLSDKNQLVLAACRSFLGVH